MRFLDSEDPAVTKRVAPDMNGVAMASGGQLSGEAIPVSREASEFERVYRANYSPVFAYVLRRAPAAVAEDVVADVFLAAWRRFADVPTDPLPWLLGVARKTLANHRRSGARREALGGELQSGRHLIEEPAAPGSTVSSGGLAHALAAVSDDDRELLTLIAWEELTTREAATVIGTSEVACRVRLYRARRRLAKALERCDDVRSTGRAAEPAATVNTERT